jgi:hypothetical protein
MLADVREEREKGVLLLVELTLRARSSALEAKATEA